MNKKQRKSANFQDFSKIEFLHLFYIWINIDSRGHTKPPKSLNIAVGPQPPPPNGNRIINHRSERVEIP